MTNTFHNNFIISEEDNEFLVNLQNEWTDVIVGRMVANNEVEHIEAARQEQIINNCKAICGFLLNLHKKLRIYLLTLETDLKLLQDPETKIIQGIIDTLNIKDQVILEQVEFVKENQMVPFKLAITDIVSEAYDKLLELRTEKQLKNVDYLIKVIVLETQKRINDSISTSQKELEDYIKDYILFEIVTLEDLKKYSIPVLNKELPSVIEFFKLDKKIIKDLRKIGIVAIIPKVHDKFNSKLHEILLAESKENYEKGEVIELLNKGYEYNNKVLKRATIVANK